MGGELVSYLHHPQHLVVLPRILSVCVLVIQSCPTLCDPMDCSLPGSFVHRFLQARTQEWAAMSDPGIKPRSPALQADSLLSEPPGKPLAFFKKICNTCNYKRLIYKPNKGCQWLGQKHCSRKMGISHRQNIKWLITLTSNVRNPREKDPFYAHHMGKN